MKKIIISFLSVFILGIIILYIISLRYYSFNKYNIHARNAVLEKLDVKYHTEFKIDSVSYEMVERQIGGAKYIHIWMYHLRDDEGREFDAYLWMYGLRGKGDGCSHAEDYFTYFSDTYGQVRIEECLVGKYELKQYRCNKDINNLEIEDYHFVCDKENEEAISAIITDVLFEELAFCPKGGLICLVTDEEGKEVLRISQYMIKEKFNKENLEMTHDGVQSYLLEILCN